MKTGGILALAVLSTILFSCGVSREPEGNGSREEAVRAEAGNYAFAAGGKVSMPRDFPGSIPLYPGAALRMAQEFGGGDSTVIMGTGAAVSEVSAFYRQEMPSRGWKLTAEAELEGERYLSFETVREAVAVVVAPAAGETVISLAYKVRPDQG